MHRIFFKTFIILFFLAAVLFAAQAHIAFEAKADRQNITVGDPVNYSIKLTCPATFKVDPPPKTPSLGSWDIRDLKFSEQASGTTPPQDKTVDIIYTLAAFTTGQVIIPQIGIKYYNDKNEIKEIKTAPFAITVESLLEKYGDQGDIRDIKPPVRIRISFFTYLLWILAFIAAAFALYFVYNKYLRPARASDIEPEIPAQPPYVTALNELNKLRNSTLVKEGLIKEFYSALSDIIRNYLAPVFSVETRDRTTAEIYYELRRAVPDKKLLIFIKDFFDECDMAKFAKYRPDEKTCSNGIENAEKIVKMSMPIEPDNGTGARQP